MDVYARAKGDPAAQWIFIGFATIDSPFVTFDGEPGVSYEFVSIGQSASGVGERVSVNLTSTLEADIVATSCVNNCSGNGFCYLGQCLCDRGFDGDVCDEESSVFEAPVLSVFPLPTVIEAFQPYPLSIFAQTTSTIASLITRVFVKEAPSGIVLRVNGSVLDANSSNVWELQQADLGDVTIQLPVVLDASNLTVEAVVFNGIHCLLLLSLAILDPLTILIAITNITM